MNWEWNWWERRAYRLFLRWPVVGLAGPLILGLLILFAGAVLAAHSTEGRFLPRNGEAAAIWITGEVALAISFTVGFVGMAAATTRGRYGRLLELHQTMQDIRAMSWEEFEDLVAANYFAQGYEVEAVGRAGPDGGRDLILRKGGQVQLVQCKHYRNSWVFERPLREFLGVIEDARADGGIFVTCGVFDQTAVQYAKNNPRLKLVAGEELREMIVRVNEMRLGGKTYPCPVCGSPMAPKTGRRGAFLSCTLYPSCKGSSDWPAQPISTSTRSTLKP